ncbi:MAG: hypothetical protein AB1713_01105 [Pseudomonadota bacterium]
MKITLIKPHKHAGRDYAAGDVIDVPSNVAAWLLERGIAAHPGAHGPGKRAPARPAGTTTQPTDH